MPDHLDLDYIGRPERASPGEGYSVAHIREQERISRSRLSPSDPETFATDSAPPLETGLTQNP